MPDPIIPAIGLGIAAVGLLATVRNGIDLILRDKNHIQESLVMDIILVGVEITMLDDRLELWKRVWLIFDETPATQLISFWGAAGAGSIQRLLGVIEQKARDIESMFDSMYGSVREDARQRLLKAGLIEPGQPASSGSQRKMMTERLQEDFDRHIKLPKKVKLALWEAPTFQNHLKVLGTSIEKLESMSVAKFEKENDFKYDEEAARKLADQSALFDLAKKASVPIRDFVMWCKDRQVPQTMAIDIQLDLAYTREKIPRNILLVERSTHDGCPYYLRIANDASPDEGYFQVALKTQGEYTDLGQLIQSLSGDQAGDHDAELPTQISQSLRKILSSSPKKLEESAYHPFSRTERYQLAYELCEVAMVVLASDALCELCVCAIRRYCIDSAMQDYEHLIRIKHAHELECGVQLTEDPNRWCKSEILDRHILRLGIVLVEISTGGIIKSAKIDEGSGELRLTLDVPGSPPEELKDCTSERIALVVKAAAGEDLSWAV